jgi:hypothetical protein
VAILTSLAFWRAASSLDFARDDPELVEGSKGAIVDCSGWDCPFHPRSSLLLSDPVKPGSVPSSTCGIRAWTPALSLRFSLRLP